MLLHIIGGNPLKDNKCCCFPPTRWMETRSCLWKLFTDHSGYMVVALKKVPIINRTSSRQGGRKRGREGHKYILVLLRSKMSMAFFDVLWQYSE
jgi:hypothetical protein